MLFRMPDWLNYEMQHKMERFRDWYERLRVRGMLNDSPRAVFSIALSCVLLLVIVLLVIGRDAPARHYPMGKQAWFYDLNTGKLFVASGSETGPIEAPSGPLPDGRPAGLRATSTASYRRRRNPTSSWAFWKDPIRRLKPEH